VTDIDLSAVAAARDGTPLRTPPVPGPSRRPTFSNFVMPTPNTDDANLLTFR
jgi:hypothetical protein